ncbi:MAG: methyl-accepting chemotaxis protein [Ancalomicrobiaceae bacterium]|nr:methyl-accepting chemotaxis protein [Ancalomicrobiaceae bacterium]
MAAPDPSHARISIWTYVILALGLIVAATLAVGVYLSGNEDKRIAVAAYRTQSHDETVQAAKFAATQIDQIYQNLRTISLLKSVRSVDRYGENLSEDGRQSVQQIFNNLASNVAVSEVYIVPVNLAPDETDAKTGEKQAPILMFDTIRLGIDPAADAKKEEVDPNAPVQEEIYEYRALAEQMQKLRTVAPRLDRFQKADLPLLTTSPLITCDNSTFNSSHKDADRTGIIFSVPFFDMAGELKGTISAIVLDSAIRKMLPDANFALVDTSTGAVFPSLGNGQQTASARFVEKAAVDPSLLYSEVTQLATKDPNQVMKLWAGNADETFLNGPEIHQIVIFEYGGYLLASTIGLLAIILSYTIGRTLRLSHDAEERLERRLAERSSEIDALHESQAEARVAAEAERHEQFIHLADGFEGSVGQIAVSLSRAAGELQATASQLTASAEETSAQAQAVTSAANEAARNTDSLADSTGELKLAIGEVSRHIISSADLSRSAVEGAAATAAVIADLSRAASRIGSIVEMISKIAGQTNLLALNATIEAARAGEAGRGFAVVAAEVKDLADQTAKATADIDTQIGAIQKTTTGAVQAIERITGTIKEIDYSTSTISAAVVEQEATTGSISMAAAHASHGAAEVTSGISGVAEAAQETGCNAARVLVTASALTDQAKHLDDELKVFLARIRAA